MAAISTNACSQSSLPIFKGQNYQFWSLKMKTFFKSQELWNLVENGFLDTDTHEPSKQLRNTRKKDSKALFMIQQALDDEIFPQIAAATTSKEAWEILKKGYLDDEKIIAIDRYIPQKFGYVGENGSAKSSLYSGLTVDSALPDYGHGSGRSTASGGHGRDRVDDRSGVGGGGSWTEEKLRNLADDMERHNKLAACCGGAGRRGGQGQGPGRGGVSGGQIVNASDGINFDAYENIPVQSTGNDIPSPASSFDDIELGTVLSENIRRCGYAKPTPIQCHAIPIAVAGRDLMACAQTGSGKTAGFCLPIIAGILMAKPSRSMLPHRTRVAHPLALIISPTRELSCQIYEEVKKFSYRSPVRAVVVYGGAPIVSQLHEIKKGVDILVATPGRLVDMIEKGRVSLSLIRYLALDEADRMLDMGFEPQIRQIVQQFDMPRPGVRQTMLFSATFPSEIQKLASEFLSNYIFLSVGRVGSSTGLITQRVEFVRDLDKKNLLLNLLASQNANGTQRQHALILIFMETKRRTDELERWLLHNGFSAIAIHGDKMQQEREGALKSFRTGLTPILVATDVAARGLDIPNVAHVINFDFPKDIDSYVHRIGRTGRAGKPGTATAFFNEKSAAIAQSLVELLKEANQEVPGWLQGYAHSAASSSGSGSGSQHFSGGSFSGYDFRGEARTGHHSGSLRGYNIQGGGHQEISDTLVDPQHTSVHDAGEEMTAESNIPEPCASHPVHYTSSGCRTSSQGFESGYGNIVATGWE